MSPVSAFTTTLRIDALSPTGHPVTFTLHFPPDAHLATVLQLDLFHHHLDAAGFMPLSKSRPCRIHHVPMPIHESPNGRRWCRHRLPSGEWCNGIPKWDGVRRPFTDWRGPRFWRRHYI